MSDLVYFKKSKLDAIADKINEKCGGVEPLSLDEMIERVKNLSTENSMNFQLESLSTESNNSSFFELPQNIDDIREFEIKFRFFMHFNLTSYLCGNFKTNSNSFYILCTNTARPDAEIEFTVSSATVKIPFDVEWHIAKIKSNKLFIDDIESDNEINWNDLGSLGNLHIFNSPQNVTSIEGKSVSYIKITDVDNDTETYYPWIIDKNFALVSEKNKVTSDKIFLFDVSDELCDYYENNEKLWDTHSMIYNYDANNPNRVTFFRFNPYIFCIPKFISNTTRGDLFTYCYNLQRATLGDVSYLNFNNCKSLKEISFTNAKISGLTNGFSGCCNLTKITGLNTSNRTQNELAFQNAFAYCYKLKDSDDFFVNCNLDFSNVTTIENIFGNCISLTHCSLKLFAKQNMAGVFSGCRNLVTVDYFDCSEATNLTNAFNSCYNLKNIPELETSNINYFNNMFSQCHMLEDIKTLNMANSKGQANMFSRCSNLKNIKFIENSIKLSISFSDSPLLTSESVQNIVNGLATVTTAQTITFHKDIALTDEQKQTINEKGWTLVQA